MRIKRKGGKQRILKIKGRKYGKRGGEEERRERKEGGGKVKSEYKRREGEKRRSKSEN